MTDPVSNADVEDVLSSIRRLVSDNKRSGSGALELPMSDRLILSPHLRVDQDGILRLKPEDAVDAAEKSDTPEGGQAAADDPVSPRPDPLENLETAGSTDGKASRIEALTAKIAALETAIARTADQWEPDGNSRDEYSGTQSEAMAWQDSVELDATGAPVHVDPDADDNPMQAGDGLDREQIVDEKALRELVSDIVRSELQGALGERITRNVRKLVRREIHRALASKDLE